MTITSAEEFVRLRTSEKPEEYRRAAAEPAAPEVWFSIIADYPEMRFWVAQNKTIPPVVLERLSEDADARVRAMVARKGSATEVVLRRLARDQDDGVRLAVARNQRTPRAVLVQLSSDGVPLVAALAAERIAADEDASSRP